MVLATKQRLRITCEDDIFIIQGRGSQRRKKRTLANQVEAKA